MRLEEGRGGKHPGLVSRLRKKEKGMREKEASRAGRDARRRSEGYGNGGSIIPVGFLCEGDREAPALTRRRRLDHEKPTTTHTMAWGSTSENTSVTGRREFSADHTEAFGD